MYVGKLQVGSASVVEISHNDQARSRGLWWGCGGVRTLFVAGLFLLFIL